jgi:hypothetical protein
MKYLIDKDGILVAKNRKIDIVNKINDNKFYYLTDEFLYPSFEFKLIESKEDIELFKFKFVDNKFILNENFKTKEQIEEEKNKKDYEIFLKQKELTKKKLK